MSVIQQICLAAPLLTALVGYQGGGLSLRASGTGWLTPPVPLSPGAPRRPSTAFEESRFLRVRWGYRLDEELRRIYPDEDGGFSLEMKELDRIEVHLPADDAGDPAGYEGSLVVGKYRRPLPVGASLDGHSGIFYWGLGPGFIGKYDFVFLRGGQGDESSGEAVRIRITVVPRFPGRGGERQVVFGHAGRRDGAMSR